MKESFEVDTYSGVRVGGKEGAGGDECQVATSTTFPLNKEKTRIEESEYTRTRFSKLRTDLQAHLRTNGFPDAKIGSNGTMRSLEDSSNLNGNPDRIEGSLHGLGLANDLLIDVGFLGPSGTYKEKGYKAANKILGADVEFVKAMHTFNISQSDITWGGEWGSDAGDNAAGKVKGRGITEFHHFEFNTSGIKYALTTSGYDKHIQSLGFTVNDMILSQKRKELYLTLVGEECVDSESVDAVAKTVKEKESAVAATTPAGYVSFNQATCASVGGEWDGTECTIEGDDRTEVVKFHKTGDPSQWGLDPAAEPPTSEA